LFSEIRRKITMAGTKAGGQKAALTNKTRHGKDFYAKIGATGGKKGTTGGFAANRELARIAGAKGGRISRRRSASEKAVA
jgi:general stress protein YciG